jgi:hypothetical protein
VETNELLPAFNNPSTATIGDEGAPQLAFACSSSFLIRSAAGCKDGLADPEIAQAGSIAKFSTVENLICDIKSKKDIAWCGLVTEVANPFSCELSSKQASSAIKFGTSLEYCSDTLLATRVIPSLCSSVQWSIPQLG